MIATLTAILRAPIRRFGVPDVGWVATNGAPILQIRSREDLGTESMMPQGELVSVSRFGRA